MTVTRRETPDYGQRVIVSFPDSDWTAEGVRVDRAKEDKERDEQGWDKKSILIHLGGERRGTLPKYAADFFGADWSDTLFFDTAPEGNATPWTLLLERSEFDVNIQVLPKELWVLRIHGPQTWAGRPARVTLHCNEEEARTELDQYVHRNWDSEMNGEPFPSDSYDRIDRYFEEVEEEYHLDEVTAPCLQTGIQQFIAPAMVNKPEAPETAPGEVRGYSVELKWYPVPGCTWQDVDEDFEGDTSTGERVEYYSYIIAAGPDVAEAIALDRFHESVCIANLDACEIRCTVAEVK